MAQEEKAFLNLAGEFAVASELNRRHVLSSVTYGAAKGADVFAMNPDMTKVVRIEAKTTDKRQWPIGQRATRVTALSSQVFWVLVHLPPPLEGPAADHAERGNHTPRYFVLSAREVYELWRRSADIYEKAYFDRHGRQFEGLGVPNITVTDAEPLEGKWGRSCRASVERRYGRVRMPTVLPRKRMKPTRQSSRAITSWRAIPSSPRISIGSASCRNDARRSVAERHSDVELGAR
jgi:hypothetical protein